MYSTEQRGKLYTDNFRLFFKNDKGTYISPMHDIPLKPDGFEQTANVYNLVIEIPRWTNAKMEMNMKEKLNPIRQDVKKGRIRFASNIFPHKGYIWNYGAIPQTWEDPSHVDPDTGCKGDGDPIDVVEIGSKVHQRGSVIKVKILGALALIDEGETDWKIVTIDVDDPLANDVGDLNSLEKAKPGFLAATVEWFRIYKIPEGKPENQFAFDGQVRDADFAVKVIQQTHEQWKSMILKDIGSEPIARACTQFECPSKLSDEAAGLLVDQHPANDGEEKIPDQVDVWHFVRS